MKRNITAAMKLRRTLSCNSQTARESVGVRCCVGRLCFSGLGARTTSGRVPSTTTQNQLYITADDKVSGTSANVVFTRLRVADYLMIISVLTSNWADMTCIPDRASFCVRVGLARTGLRVIVIYLAKPSAHRAKKLHVSALICFRPKLLNNAPLFVQWYPNSCSRPISYFA
jgi:hypothetical protein